MNFVNYFSNMDLYNSAKLLYPNISYIEETEKVILVEKLLPKNNQIFYTTTDGQIVTVANTIAYGITLQSNTYNGSIGVLTFNNDVTSVGEQYFLNKSTLETVILPETITRIGDEAFRGCPNLQYVDIPNNVNHMGNEYTSGYLTGNYRGVFNDCTSLQSIKLPNKLTVLSSNMFNGCTNLSTVEIPSGVTIIGNTYAFSGDKGVFNNCTSLTSIYYKETSSQFTAITKGINWKNGVPTSCKVHCTDGDFPITQFA